MNKYQNYFEENGYVIVPNVLDESSLYLAYNYTKIKVEAIDIKLLERPDIYDTNWDGNWGDIQSPNTYSCYGDPFMDTLLFLLNGRMNEFTGLDLIPTYSYWRFYEQGEELLKHSDRESCEISTTLSIGKNYSNLNEKYDWPIWIENKNKEHIPIVLEDGDMLIYRGCELDHWREPLKGNHHAQVFLHYNDKNGPYNTPKDGRPVYGLPATFANRIKEKK